MSASWVAAAAAAERLTSPPPSISGLDGCGRSPRNSTARSSSVYAAARVQEIRSDQRVEAQALAAEPLLAQHDAIVLAARGELVHERVFEERPHQLQQLRRRAPVRHFQRRMVERDVDGVPALPGQGDAEGLRAHGLARVAHEADRDLLRLARLFDRGAHGVGLGEDRVFGAAGPASGAYSLARATNSSSVNERVRGRAVGRPPLQASRSSVTGTSVAQRHQRLGEDRGVFVVEESPRDTRCA
jgi:hypothetical protein